MPSQRPLRLLQIASSSFIGGAEQLMLNVIRYADPERLAPYLLSLTGRGPLARLADQAGSQGFNWALDSLANPLLLRRMQLYLRRGQYDVIQCYGLRAELLTRWVAHGMSARVVSSVVSINPQRRWIHWALDQLTMDGVTAWMSTSDAAKRAYIQKTGAPAARIFTIPTGIAERPVADAEAKARARKRFKIEDGAGPVLAMIANVRPAKGYPDLIDAVAAIKPRWPNLVCLCAGRDDSAGAIPELAKSKGLEGTMRWLGFVADAPTVYDAADVAVLASHWEGMPHALIEALRAGLPTVATDVGGNGEVVRHEREGLLCAARMPESLAAALARALDDEPARRAWGASARERFESSFRVETMVDRMTGLYEYVAGRGPRPSFEEEITAEAQRNTE